MSPEQSEEILRLRALTAFLGAGMATAPTPDLIVRWLGEARRSVTIIQARGEPLDEWLASETRLRGIRENAAVLAAMGSQVCAIVLPVNMHISIPIGSRYSSSC